MRARRPAHRSRPAIRIITAAAVLALSLSVASLAHAQAGSASAQARSTKQLKWGPAPPVFRKGARMAVVSGDPMASGEFVVQLQMPSGYRIAPHFHPTDEHLRILSGTFLVGMGDRLDLAKTKRLSRGDTITAPATMHHFAATRGRTVVQVSGTGPFQLTYVDKADLPKP